MRPVGTQSRFTTPWYGDFFQPFQFFHFFQLSAPLIFQLFQLPEFITAPLKWIAFRKSYLARYGYYPYSSRAPRGAVVMTRHELIARLEAATGSDVSLDIAIHSFINAGKRIRTDRHGFPMEVKGYTHSIDAAAIETSQKAQRGVHLVDLAAYIDKRRAAAAKECRQLTGTT